MDKRILITAGVVLLAAITLFSILMIRSCSDTDSLSEAEVLRQNTVRIAREYYQKGEYQRALDLIDNVLIHDPDHVEARELRDSIINTQRSRATDEKAGELALQDRLKESLEELGSSIRESRPSAALPTPPRRRRFLLLLTPASQESRQKLQGRKEKNRTRFASL